MKKIEAKKATGMAIKISTKNQSTAHAHPHDAIFDSYQQGLWGKRLYMTRLFKVLFTYLTLELEALRSTACRSTRSRV